MPRPEIMCLAAAALLLVSGWPEAATRPPTPIVEWTGPGRGPGARDPTCGADVELVAALPDPTAVPDRLGESVWIRNLEARPMPLVGWSLRSGRARHALDDLTLAPGERIALAGPELRPVHLPNGAGRVALVDPCGVTTQVAWDEAEPGLAVVSANERAPPPWNP